MNGAGVTAVLMGGDGLYDPEFINLGGAADVDGDLCTTVGLPLDKLPNSQAFAAAYAAEYPEEEIGAYDAYSYDAANVLVQAILKVATEQGVEALTSPAGRDAAIAAVAATDMDGVTGKVSFDEKGDTTNKAITVYRVEGGAWVPFIVPE